MKDCKYNKKDTGLCSYFQEHNITNKAGLSILMTLCCNDVGCPIKHPEMLKELIIEDKENG